MFTFKQITEIEAKRRQIEALQDALNHQSEFTEFAVRLEVGAYGPVDRNANPLLREALLKYTVSKIVFLLDECEHLGVDINEGKKALADFLATLRSETETGIQ
jgi:hypothetical protein